MNLPVKLKCLKWPANIQLCSCLLVLAGIFNSVTCSAVQKKSDRLIHTYSGPEIAIVEESVYVRAFAQQVHIKVFLPPNYQISSNKQYPTLYINDGQDAEAVNLAESLQELYALRKIQPIIVIAIPMLPDRMATYGYSDREKQKSLPAETRFGLIGIQAHEYSEWLSTELVPYIDSHYRTINNSNARSILGWSLGAANAFNIGWNYPDCFGVVGGFSSSFWLSKNSSDTSTQLVQQIIASKPLPENFKVWLAVGLKEETDDRDSDGIIDVLDDSQNVVKALEDKVLQSVKPKVSYDFSVTTFADGEHNQESWKQMLPIFLQWAYPVDYEK